MTSKSPVRSCEDIDETSLSYAEVKALATGNPYIREKMELDVEVSKLKLLKANHTSQHYRLEDNIAIHYPAKIKLLTEQIDGYGKDIETYQKNRIPDKDSFVMKVLNSVYADRKEAGLALLAVARNIKRPNQDVDAGEYQGFKICLYYDSFASKFYAGIKGVLTHKVELGGDAVGNILRISNTMEGMETKRIECEDRLKTVQHQLETAKLEVIKEFPKEEELKQKVARLSELNVLLNIDGSFDEVEKNQENEKQMAEPVEKCLIGKCR